MRNVVESACLLEFLIPTRECTLNWVLSSEFGKESDPRCVPA